MTNSNPGAIVNTNLPNRFFIWGIPLIVAFSYGFLACQTDLRVSIAALAGISAVIMTLLCIALYWGEARDIGWSPRTILFTAGTFRLMFLFLSPELSDDIYRYLWDGLSILHGNNPYTFAPSSAPPFVGSVALLSRVNHPHLITIYPPMAQIIFAGGAFWGGVVGMKALLVAMDVAVCAMIVHVLLLMKLPPSRAVIYAWHPLPILEIASSGHIDGAGIFFLMLAFVWLFPPNNSAALPSPRKGAVAAGFAFSCAVLVKLFPLVFLPVFLFLAGRKGRGPFMLGVVVGAAALSIPFLPGLYNMFTTLDTYLRNWEFAGFAFQSLHKIFPNGAMARQILAVAFLLIAATLYASLFRKRKNVALNLYTPALFPAAFQTAYGIALAFLLLTPTLHPWYALYLACLLPFVPSTAGLVLTWAVLLSYRVLINFAILGTWEENDAIPAIIWVAAVGAPILSWLAEKWTARFIHVVKR